MDDLPDTDPRGAPPERGQRLLAALRPVARQAALLIDRLRVLALAAGAAGAWLWGLLFWPLDVGSGWTLAGALLVLLALLGPALVLGLFARGLQELVALPGRLVATVRAGQGEAAAVYAGAGEARPARSGRIRRFWQVVRGLWALRAALLESRDLLIGSVALIRLASPVVLAVVVVAAGLGLLLIAGAVAGTLIALLA